MVKQKVSIKIDPEFKSLIPSLAPDEFEQLEKNILAEGCRDDIVVWRTKTAEDEVIDIIIDGHNRYEICTKNEIKFNTTQAVFTPTASREEIKIWIYDNQFGRRNISDALKIDLALQKAELLKPLAKKNQSLAGGDKKSEKAVLTETTKAVDAPINIRKAVADDAGVSEDTVRKYTKVKESGDEELLEQVKSGEKKIGTAYKEVTDIKPKNTNSNQSIVEISDTTQVVKCEYQDSFAFLSDIADEIDTIINKIEVKNFTDEESEHFKNFVRMDSIIEKKNEHRIRAGIERRVPYLSESEMKILSDKKFQLVLDKISMIKCMIAVKFCDNTDTKEPPADKQEANSPKKEIVEIDPPEYRTKILQGNKEQLPISKIFFLFHTDTPRRNFYRQLEQDLGLCDKDDKILLSYEDYKIFITEYDPSKANEPERTKSRINKIKDALKSA